MHDVEILMWLRRKGKLSRMYGRYTQPTIEPPLVVAGRCVSLTYFAFSSFRDSHHEPVSQRFGILVKSIDSSSSSSQRCALLDWTSSYLYERSSIRLHGGRITKSPRWMEYLAWSVPQNGDLPIKLYGTSFLPRLSDRAYCSIERSDLTGILSRT